MRGFLIGTAAVLAAIIFRWPLQSLIGDQYAYLFFYPAVFLASWFGGFAGGAVAAMLSATAAQYFYVPPAGVALPQTPADLLAQVVFLGSCLAVALMVDQRHRFARERTLFAAQAERSREWLDAIIADVPAVVWETWGTPHSALQRTDFVNRHVERMLGYTTQEWLSAPDFWLTIVHPEDRERAALEAADIFRGRTGGTSRFRWVRKDGSIVWVEAQSRVIIDAAGDPVGMRGVTIDISDSIARQAERGELLRQTQRAREEAERANRLKDDFLMTLSHELRTPLNALWGWTRMLRTGQLAADRRNHALETIERNSQVQLQLVEDLLDVSQITTGKLRLNLRPVDIPRLVEGAVDAMRPTADAKQIALHVDVHGHVPDVHADADRLQQVVRNLLANAVKFTPSDGEVRTIVRQRFSQVEITVRDTGIGIPSEMLAVIFERFRQAESGTTREYTGLGLGLPIARSLVEAHGGTLTGRSDGAGHGSEFTVLMPITPPVVASGEPLHSVLGDESQSSSFSG